MARSAIVGRRWLSSFDTRCSPARARYLLLPIFPATDSVDRIGMFQMFQSLQIIILADEIAHWQVQLSQVPGRPSQWRHWQVAPAGRCCLCGPVVPGRAGTSESDNWHDAHDSSIKTARTEGAGQAASSFCPFASAPVESFLVKKVQVSIGERRSWQFSCGDVQVDRAMIDHHH